MSKITYNADLLKIMTLFESVTRTSLKDCFIDSGNLLTFVVGEIEIGKAIGKNASNVKRLEMLLKRKVKILAFNPEITQFIRNLIYPISGVEIEVQDKVVVIKGHDSKTKAFLIGRDQSNLKNNTNIVKKYFKEIETIKVV